MCVCARACVCVCVLRDSLKQKDDNACVIMGGDWNYTAHFSLGIGLEKSLIVSQEMCCAILSLT